MVQPSASSPNQNQNADRSKIAERIRKLLAKAAGTENEIEAMAFNAKAHAMLLEHRLSMSDVHEKDATDEDTTLDSALETDPHPWRRRLGQGVAELYLCDYFYTPDERPSTRRTVAFGKPIEPRMTKFYVHNFVGKPSGITTAKLMFVYLMDTVDRLAKAGARNVPPKEKSPYRVAFRESCVKRIRHRIERLITEAKVGGFIETESGTTLPALLSMYEQAAAENTAAIAKAVGELVVVNRKAASDIHALGAMHGAEAGDKIGLDQQVAADKTKRIGNK